MSAHVTDEMVEAAARAEWADLYGDVRPVVPWPKGRTLLKTIALEAARRYLTAARAVDPLVKERDDLKASCDQALIEIQRLTNRRSQVNDEPKRAMLKHPWMEEASFPGNPPVCAACGREQGEPCDNGGVPFQAWDEDIIQ